MLSDVKVQPMLPVSDLPAAEKFYEKTLGLKRVGGMPGVATTYKSGDTTLNVYKSEYAGTNQGTAALWEVDDVEKTAKQLKDKGVKFESYDMPDLEQKGDVYQHGDFRVAWFKDPAGNILSIQNRPRGTH
ncbi:MAG TPA: VOC family protein [Thermoanaerobaculia bacterium]|nr:VOC family protein [Thermoanaerobaculia bacterium]